jgi:predicted amidohydrolase YtcJ
MRYLLYTPVLFLLLLPGCGKSGGPESTGANTADFLMTNARVYTANKEQPWAQALAIRGEEVVYVGDHRGAAAYLGRGCEQLDMGGGVVLPLNRSEGLTLSQAIAAYTALAPQQADWDEVLGSFETGKRADLVVLDRNLVDMDASEMQDARVLLTMVGGRVVSEARWRREDESRK